jgi:hypothetical protein
LVEIALWVEGREEEGEEAGEAVPLHVFTLVVEVEPEEGD